MRSTISRFKKRAGSRAAAFEEEKPFLLPLPAAPFELAMWEVATVQYNYHVSVDKQNTPFHTSTLNRNAAND
jgi:hypothetical protein